MANTDIYKQVFIKNFNVKPEQLNSLTYRSISAWDSIGHMSLIASIEEAFDIMLDTDDILKFSSFEKGRIILDKYKIAV